MRSIAGVVVQHHTRPVLVLVRHMVVALEAPHCADGSLGAPRCADGALGEARWADGSLRGALSHSRLVLA